MRKIIISILPFASFVGLFIFTRNGGSVCLSNDGCGWGPVLIVILIGAILSVILFLKFKSSISKTLGFFLVIFPIASGLGYFFGSETGPKEYCDKFNGIETCQECTTPLFPSKDSHSSCKDIIKK